MKIYSTNDKGLNAFNYVLEKLDIKTPFLKEHINNIEGFNDSKKLEEEFFKIQKAINYIDDKKEDVDKIVNILSRFKQIRGIINALKIPRTLDDTEIYELKRFLILFEELISLLDSDYVDIPRENIQNILRILDPDSKRNITFSIYDLNDKKLLLIRENKRRIEKQILSSNDVLALEKREEVVKREQKRIRKLLISITNDLKKYAYDFKSYTHYIRDLDFIISKAKLAVELKLTKPEFSNDMTLIIEDGFHIMLKDILKKDGLEYKKISVELKKGVLYLTGANMGGKSLGLEMIIQNQLLFQYGFYVAAKSFKTTKFDYIAELASDNSNLESGLSSFGSEIIWLNEVFKEPKDKKGLILLDELCRGTNPLEAIKLIRGIKRYIQSLNVISIISTHYDGVTSGETYYEVIGLKNFDFNKGRKDIVQLQKNMDYRWIKTTDKDKVPKEAILIAKWLGLKDEIIEACKGEI